MAKKKPSTVCQHLTAFPIEFVFGKIATTDPATAEPFRCFMDWRHANMYSAHRMRVSKLYCPECKEEIKMHLPIDLED